MYFYRIATAVPVAAGLVFGAAAFAQEVSPREFVRDLAKGKVFGVAALPAGELLVSSSGLYRSTDSGKAWKRVGPEIDMGGALHVATDGVYALGTVIYRPDGKTQIPEGERVVGLYRSRDAGATWTAVHTGTQAEWEPTAVMRTPKGTLVVALGSFGGNATTGIARSLDDGKTWKSTASNRLVLGFAAAADGTLYAASDSGVLVSRDDGGSWTVSSPDNLMMSVHTEGDMVVAGSIKGLYRSSDKGRTWALSGPFEEVVVLPVVLSRGRLGGVTQSMTTGEVALLLSSDDGKTWKPAAGKIPARMIDRVSTDGTAIYLIARNEGLLRSRDDGATFETIFP